MAKSAKVIHPSANTFTDRRKEENERLGSAMVRLETIDTMLLLFDSAEESVLLTVFRHLTDYVRRSDVNVNLLKAKNVLDVLLGKGFYCTFDSTMVKRLALYLATTIIENMDTLKELEVEKILEVVNACLTFYLEESDDFCIEYLSVMINKCLDDPQAVKVILQTLEFVEKFFDIISNTSNPDVVFHSFELLEKMLLVQCLEEVQIFFANPTFPINRVLCELTNEFFKIRNAALKVVNILITETSGTSPFNHGTRVIFVLEQLTRLYCENMMPDAMEVVIDVLAAAMRNEHMAILFFELNLFQRFLVHWNEATLSPKLQCRSLSVVAEIALYPKFLDRLVQAHIPEKLLQCFLQEIVPSYPVVLGLNRLMKSSDATNKILQAYERGLIPKIIQHLPEESVQVKIREQLAELLKQLFTESYHKTCEEVLNLKFPLILSEIFAQPSETQSIDLYLLLLAIIENLAQNTDYREQMCQEVSLIESMANLLANSFSTSILVSNIFRCLCCLVDEETVRSTLLETFILSSIKRGLKSVANLVKTSVTNFIMQTTRFPEFVQNYVDKGVLEVLIMHQKHAFCVPTWASAIESILSKNPTLKFCIRNHLGFTDITAGYDFYVSKMKFNDFRDFQNILNDNVSPIQPILAVNFDRPEDPPEYIVTLPRETLSLTEILSGQEICYCRRPGDAFLPQYLNDINAIFEQYGLSGNAAKRCIDFDNIAKRAKLIAELVARVLGHNLKILDLNTNEECSQHTVKCHLKEMARKCYTTIIPIGAIRSGCQFERAVLFKGLADQVGLPCTLQRSVDGRMLFNEVPLPLELERDKHCHKDTMKFMPWRMLRPTHIVDLMYNVGELYPLQSRQALQYLRLY